MVRHVFVHGAERAIARRVVRRRAERGAALFIVMMVILALTGVGLFAARSASMDVAIAGRYRQSAQTRQITRLGVQASLHELARDPSTYIRAMQDTSLMNDATMTGLTNSCVNDIPVALDGANLAHGCFRFGYDGIQSSIQTDLADLTFQLMDPGDLTNESPGSLGEAAIRPDFFTEMTDQEALPWPVAGFSTNGTGAGSSNAMHFYLVTMSGTGQIVPRPTPLTAGSWGLLKDASGTAAPNAFMSSLEQSRAHVIVGPIQL